MKLSVILPCYNGAETIAVQLEALAAQQWAGDWEVVVVNNGSSDRSIEIVETYRDRLPKLQIVDAYKPPGPRLGVPHSYNVGIQAAAGEAFLFCEADDQVAPGWLVAMAAALTHHDFVACRMDYQTLNEPWRLQGFGEGFQSSGLCQLGFAPDYQFAIACTFGIRRHLYETVGELNPMLPCSFEADYCWRAQHHGFQLHFVPDAVVAYRLRHTFQGMFKQARGYGKDLIFLQRYYRAPISKIEVLRQTMQMIQGIPEGVRLFFQMRQEPFAKGEFAMWFWTLGLRVGMVEGLLQRLPTMPREPVMVLS